MALPHPLLCLPHSGSAYGFPGGVGNSVLESVKKRVDIEAPGVGKTLWWALGSFFAAIILQVRGAARMLVLSCSRRVLDRQKYRGISCRGKYDVALGALLDLPNLSFCLKVSFLFL